MAENPMLEKLMGFVPEESKEACLAELRICETKAAAAEVFARYGVDAKERLADLPGELDGAALDDAAGGCGSTCGCC